MTNNSLTLIPYGKPSFTIGLLEDDNHHSSIEKIIDTAENNSVFSDLSYEFILNNNDISNVKSVSVFINDTYEPSTFDNGKIRFPARGVSDKRIFLDCYGFVEISLVIIMNDETKIKLTSGYLPVLVRRGKLNEAVKKMVNYVYKHQESFLLNGEPKPRNLTNLKENGYKSLTSQIILAEEIATIYEKSYAYFKANSRFRIKKVATIDHFEKLQYITSETLRYIVSHPEQLKAINNTAGIRIGERVCQPEKSLSLRNINSYAIYENEVILGFLRKMVDEIVELKKRCKNLIKQIPNAENYSAEYIYSSFFMFSETRHMLENSIQQLSRLYDKYTQLLGMYRDAFKIPIEPIRCEPRPTAVFLSVPQYNKIFVRIHQWFSFGIYDFAKETFMLSFIKVSSLYESYLLAKIMAYFMNRGYTKLESKRCIYPVHKRWKFKNTNITNTFVFYNGKNYVTLYYQPVIFDTEQSAINGIGLYRNNSIPVFTGEEDTNRQGGHYYVPDYLIKVQNDDTTKYLIIDAKFSDIQSVRRFYVKDLAFKYLFSISPIDNKDVISGMCIMYGKCSEQDEMQSAYDKKLPNNDILPIAELIPLMESISNDEQYNKLDLLFKNLLS